MEFVMSHQNTLPTTAIPVQVIYQRPKPRIAKGIVVLLLSGLAGLVIFAMGQGVWGAIWRGWLVNLLIIGVVYLFAH